MKLYEDHISSAVARVRIALTLKGHAADSEVVTILGAEARSQTPEYRNINPQRLVPALATDNGAIITQSLAIIEYLDEMYPSPALLPSSPEERARARAVALSIASEIHALLTPRVAARLRSFGGLEASAISEWTRHWLLEGLPAIEALLIEAADGPLCFGDSPSVADIFLFPQAINTERAGISLAQWPRIASIVSELRAIPAFAENVPAPRA